ncbi:MAG: fructosamine kinase family protein [Rhodobacteraceae bacterium]|nr:fructosamine kinase family protein [Paracoccaceae bacterium]
MPTLARHAAALLRDRVLHATRLHGGDLAEVVAVTLASGREVIAKSGPAPMTEAAMLRAIAATGTPVPEVLAADETVLVMARLPAGGGLGGTTWADLGRLLAGLHASTGPHYGWTCDYAFGGVPIRNAASADWPRFWSQNRLSAGAAPLPDTLRARIVRLTQLLPAILPATPPASLLHGDLWSGNVLCAGSRVSGLIDPACYWGHGEVDLAMLCLFAEPSADFWDAYGRPPDGWPQRRAVYQIWPALVHLSLFGEGYRGLVERCLAEAGA